MANLVFDDGKIPEFHTVPKPVVDVPLGIPSQGLDSLVTVSGNLRDAYKQIVPGSIRCVDELMHERRTNPIAGDGSDLRKLGFYCGDGIIYFVRDKKAMLAITRAKQNLVLRHIDDAFTQLTTQQNYVPDPLEAEAAIADMETVVIDLSQLCLQKYTDEVSYLSISTAKYEDLHSGERAFAERVYGQGTEFPPVMQMLSAANIADTRIWVLDPSYVRDNVKKSAFLCRAAFLGGFDDASRCSTRDRGVNSTNRLRGVPITSGVCEADTQKNVPTTTSPQEITVAQCYDTLLANPDKALTALDDRRSTELLKIITQYLSSRLRQDS